MGSDVCGDPAVPRCPPGSLLEVSSAGQAWQLRVQVGPAQLLQWGQPWPLLLSRCCLTPSSHGPDPEGCVPCAGNFWASQGCDHVLFFQQHLQHTPSSWTVATSAAWITRWWWGWQSCCRSCASTGSRWPSAACRFVGHGLGGTAQVLPQGRLVPAARPALAPAARMLLLLRRWHLHLREVEAAASESSCRTRGSREGLHPLPLLAGGSQPWKEGKGPAAGSSRPGFSALRSLFSKFCCPQT